MWIALGARGGRCGGIILWGKGEGGRNTLLILQLGKEGVS